MTSIRTTDGGIRYTIEANMGMVDITMLCDNDQPAASFSFGSLSQALEWLETIENPKLIKCKECA